MLASTPPATVVGPAQLTGGGSVCVFAVLVVGVHAQHLLSLHMLLFHLLHIEIVELEDLTCLGRNIPHGAVVVAVSSLGIELNIEHLVLILC